MFDQLSLDGSTRQQKLYDYSIEILRIAEPSEGYYLATSFGKDSIAVQRLCDEAGVKYDAHNNVTGIDPPELVYFGRKYYPDVQRDMYKKSMWQLILEHRIMPTRQKRYCCAALKEDHGGGRRCVMGIRAAESSRRKNTWGALTNWHILKVDRFKYGLRLFDADDIQRALQNCPTKGVLTVSPMIYWNDNDLWDFIKDRKLPYCCLYDEGWKRLGCIGCPCASENVRRKGFERWPKFKNVFLYFMQKVIDSDFHADESHKNAEEWFEDWLTWDRKCRKAMNGQMGLDDLEDIELMGY